jgi:hypothetical protein
MIVLPQLLRTMRALHPFMAMAAMMLTMIATVRTAKPVTNCSEAAAEVTVQLRWRHDDEVAAREREFIFFDSAA